MNKLLKKRKGYKGGVSGTKFVPKNQGENLSQKVKKAPEGKKLKY